MYIVSNGDRAVFESKKYGRYYVRGIDDLNDELELFKTYDYLKALEVCNRTNEVWYGFEITEV